MGKTPTEFEQQVIDLYLNGIKPYSMARMQKFRGYYPATFDRILQKYGYKKRVPKSLPNSFEQELISFYQLGYSVPQMIKMKQFEGATLSKIYSVLIKHGINRRSNKINSRVHNVYHGFFTKIDTEEKAYWLGFIYADGYITKRGNYVGLALAQRDKSHLEKLVRTLQTDYTIKEYKVTNGYGKGNTFCRLILCSEIMKTDLVSKGVLINKSLKLIFPSFQIVPVELIRHFIRGYFDGDGSLSHYGPNNKNHFTIKICGTYEFLSNLKSCLRDALELGGLGSICKSTNNNKNNYYLTIGGNIQVTAVLNHLYKNATIYLERKYFRYLHFLQIANKDSFN